VSSDSLSWRVASQPSRTGRCMSIRIRSGRSARALATPSPPSTATTTSKPFLLRRRISMSRLYSLSSTRRSFGIAGGPPSLRRRRPGVAAGLEPAVLPGRFGIPESIGGLQPGRNVDSRAAAVLAQQPGQAVAVDRLGQVVHRPQRLPEAVIVYYRQHDDRD